jgi:hypothetical protein
MESASVEGEVEVGGEGEGEVEVDDAVAGSGVFPQAATRVRDAMARMEVRMAAPMLARS